MPYIYTAVNGDTWDSIAYKATGDEFMCDQLEAANSRDLSETIMFIGGENVTIPDDLREKSTVIKAPWGT